MSSAYVPDAHNGPVVVNALAPVPKSIVSVIVNGVCAPCATPAKPRTLATASKAAFFNIGPTSLPSARFDGLPAVVGVGAPNAKLLDVGGISVGLVGHALSRRRWCRARAAAVASSSGRDLCAASGAVAPRRRSREGVYS